MERLILNKRDKKSNHYAKQERRRGLIPGVVYGKNVGNFMFEVGELELNKQVMEVGEHGVLDLDLGETSIKALIKEIQREPVLHKIIHIDLQEINSDGIIETEVPILFQNEGLIGKQGGILQKEKNSIRIQCSANKLPKNINVDLSKLKIGSVLRTMDVELSEELIMIEDPDTVIVTVTAPTFKNVIGEDEKVEEIRSEKKE